MRKHAIIAGALLAMHVAPLYSAELPGMHFDHIDWEIACDNTRTCRAAGYQSEEAGDDGEERLPVSVQLVRKAGPHAAVTGDLQLMTKNDDPTEVPAVEMKIDGRSSGNVRLHSMGGGLSPTQVNALLAVLAKDSVITFSAGRYIWTLSTGGAAAVLLKMDEFQGRIGTPGALLRKGNKPENGVLPPLPMPVVLAAPVPKIKEGVNPLAAIKLPLLLAELRKGNDDCDKIAEPDSNDNESADKDSNDSADKDSNDIELKGFELSKDKLLVTALCTVPAYNIADAFWVINRKPPYAPVLVTSAGVGYSDGEISSHLKLRSSGDCATEDTWTWNGQQFIHTLSLVSTMCRGFNDGGLIEYVASVRRPGVK